MSGRPSRRQGWTPLPGLRVPFRRRFLDAVCKALFSFHAVAGPGASAVRRARARLPRRGRGHRDGHDASRRSAIAADPTQVVESQRIMLLTSTQLINMVKLVSTEEAQAVVDRAIFDGDDGVHRPASRRRSSSSARAFRTPPTLSLLRHPGPARRQLRARPLRGRDPVRDARNGRLRDRLARTSSPPEAYRRPLSQGEQDRLTGPTGLYYTLKSQIVNGCQVTTDRRGGHRQLASTALFMTPQLLWRWELGGGTPSTAPPGIYLTDARAGVEPLVLPDRRAARRHADRRRERRKRCGRTSRRTWIASSRRQTSRDWLTQVMKMYFTLNQLPGVIIDPTVAPIVAGGAVYADLEEESQLLPRRRDVERQGHGPDHVAQGVPQQQPRDDDLQRPGAGGRDADELRRDDAARPTSAPACSPTRASSRARPGRPASASSRAASPSRRCSCASRRPPPPDEPPGARRADRHAEEDAGRR